jgi:hypothetical protein
MADHKPVKFAVFRFISWLAAAAAARRHYTTTPVLRQSDCCCCGSGGTVNWSDCQVLSHRCDQNDDNGDNENSEPFSHLSLEGADTGRKPSDTSSQVQF